MAQSAVSAIRTGCQWLSEGKAEIDKFKKTVEGGVKDAQAIYGQVTGLWGWVKGLFGAAPKSPSPVPQIQTATVDVPKTVRKTKEPELSYEEYQARSVHEICENLKVYFEAIRALKAHCRQLEEQSLTTEKVADSAIDRIELEWQMNQLAVQVREAMVYTPESLGLQALYKRFLEMYEQILEEQEFARATKEKKERDLAWQLEHRKEILTYKLIYAIAVALGLLEILGLYFTL
jgi:2-methylisocitrate lyase-like PEP mutase family enzyme